jgi:hypothetical protein
MFIDHQQLNTLGLSQFEAMTAATTSATQSLWAISNEVADYSKKNLESSFALREKLVQARKLDEIVQLHSDFAKAAYDEFIARANKIGNIYADLAKETFRVTEVGLGARSSDGSSANASKQASARKQDAIAA